MLNPETTAQLHDVRVTTQAFLDEAKLSAKRVITLTINRTPARVLSYRLYGDSSIGPEIGLLNKDINIAYMEGDVEVLTE